MKTIDEIRDRGFGEILDCLNAGVYITDTDRCIVFWNRAAEQITGYSAAEVVGRRCSANVLSHTDKDGRPLCTTDLCPLHRAMTLEKSGQEPIIVYTTSKSGARLPLSTSVAPVCDDDGRVIGGVEVFRDERQAVRELELARTVQRQMLTPEPPGDGRVSFAVQYAPKEMIGGDFYHFSRTSEDAFEMFLGDAAGHGPSAALYTALIYGLLMECREMLGSPASLTAELNRRACERAGGLGFFTAVCVAVNAADGSATYCSAGHPPLLLQRKETGRVERLDLAQLPVGVHEEADYEERVVVLESGDRLLAYSDGVTDVPLGGDRRLGVEGLASLLAEFPPEEDHRLDRLYAAVLEQCTAVEAEDDVTLMSCVFT